MQAQQELGVKPYLLKIGEATINLSSPPKKYLTNEIKWEIGVDETLSLSPKIRTFSDPRGRIVSPDVDTALGVFSTIITSYGEATIADIERTTPFGLKTLIVTPESFRNIRGSASSPLDWVGVYVWFNGTVIYNVDYIRSVLAGDGKFGGAVVDINTFCKEAFHELRESYISSMFFHNNEEIEKYFWMNNLWYMEGLSVTLSGQVDEISNEMFIQGMRNLRERYPDFSITQLIDRFWTYDNSPPNKNIVYNYCGRFIKQLAPLINKKLQEKALFGDRPMPYEGLYSLVFQAVERYKKGHRESMIDDLEKEDIITREELQTIEREWVSGLLTLQGDTLQDAKGNAITK